MQKNENSSVPKGLVLKAVVVFIVSYLIFLFLWIGIKDHYGKGITFTASKLAAGIKNVTFVELTEGRDMVQATFSPRGRGSNMLIDIPVKTSSYTFNAPLTLAILSALYPFVGRRKKAYGEALLMLLSVHILYVFSLEAKELSSVLINRNLERPDTISAIFYQFLWSFTDNMIIRFEPFLIGFYLFVRFNR